MSTIAEIQDSKFEEDSDSCPFVNYFTFPDFPSDKESLNAAFSKARSILKAAPNDYQVIFWDIESHSYKVTSESLWDFRVRAGYPREMCYTLVTF